MLSALFVPISLRLGLAAVSGRFAALFPIISEESLIPGSKIAPMNWPFLLITEKVIRVLRSMITRGAP